MSETPIIVMCSAIVVLSNNDDRIRLPQATTGSAGGARLGVVLFPMTTTVIILHEPRRRVRRYRYRVSIGPSRSLTEFNTTILFVTHVSTTASTTTSGGGCGQPDRSVALYADVEMWAKQCGIGGSILGTGGGGVIV